MLIRADDIVHFGVFAPSRSGKGTSSVIPTLLSWPGPAVVVDLKGENYALTHEHRCREFAPRRSVRLDPLGRGRTAGLNPLFFHPPDSPALLDKCRDIARWLVHRKGTEPDPHWNDKAEKVFSVFCYYVARCETDPARRNLLSVRAICRSLDAYHASLGVMRMHGGMLAEQADALASIRDKELGSCLSTLDRQVDWMDSPLVAESLRASSFDPLELRDGTLDVFLTVPPESIDRMGGWLRLMLGSMLDRLIGVGPDESRQVLFLVDEAAHLGKMQILEDAVTLLAGYGIRVGLYFQSINQLQKCYGDNAATVLDNLHTQFYFGISNSFETAEAISKRIGDCTIVQRSENDTRGRSRSTGGGPQAESGNTSTSLSVTTSEMARRWAKAEEIMTLPADMALVFHRNMPVLPVRKCNYYESRAFRNGRAGDDSGLGPGAGLMAALLLLAGLLLSALVARLPPPATTQRTSPTPPQPARGRLQPAAVVPQASAAWRPGLRPPPPNRNRRTTGRPPGRGGHPNPTR